jgi:hypothetical protein
LELKSIKSEHSAIEQREQKEFKYERAYKRKFKGYRRRAIEDEQARVENFVDIEEELKDK